MTAFADVAQAVIALKEGASNYLIKPFVPDELLHDIARIETAQALRRDLIGARQALTQRPPANRLIGQSPQMLKIQTRIEAIAHSDAATLITGESGTGKELVAHLLHDRSARVGKPFVAVNCAGFPDTLIESELFGFERGAFTGAIKRRDGRFKAADGGTLFLDEIAELPLAAQAKLLRVLQEGMLEPLGTDTAIKVDVRLVSATHRNLRERIAQGLFREDLFYRINVLDVALPALRDREGDLSILIQLFLEGFARADGAGTLQVPTISADAYAALTSYRYPGNVRELAHAIEHAVVMAGGGEITLDHLPAPIAEEAPLEGPATITTDALTGAKLVPLGQAMREFEKTHLLKVLNATGGKRVRAAEILGISRKNLWEKLRSHDHRDVTAADSKANRL
jgi:DNA-binding NtrC family response regulator